MCEIELRLCDNAHKYFYTKNHILLIFNALPIWHLICCVFYTVKKITS